MQIIKSFTEDSARLWHAAEWALEWASSCRSIGDDIHSDENLLVEMTVISLCILWVDFCQSAILPYAQNACARKKIEKMPLNWYNSGEVKRGLRRLEIPNKAAESIASTLFPVNSPFPKINATRNFFAHRSPASHSRLESAMGEKLPCNCSGAYLCGKFIRGARQMELWVRRSQTIGGILCEELARH